MKTVWKFRVERAGHGAFIVQAPRGAKPMTVQLQDGKPVLWMLVNDGERLEPMGFQVFGTGWDVDIPLGLVPSFVGTWQEGEFVWHLFHLRNSIEVLVESL